MKKKKDKDFFVCMNDANACQHCAVLVSHACLKIDDCCKFYGKQVVNNESPRCEEHGSHSGVVV